MIGVEGKGRGDVLNTSPFTRHTPTVWSGALWLGKGRVSWTLNFMYFVNSVMYSLCYMNAEM